MENQAGNSTRPTFLTVLCIISFVGLGFSILNNISSLLLSSTGSWLYSMMQNNLEMALQETSKSDPGSALLLEHIFDAILRLFEVLPLFSSLILACTVVALLGVFFMWNLNKVGFYLYTGAKVVMIFIPILLLGYNFLSVMLALWAFFGAAVFVTLYGLNLKVMK
jgi:hypothetical protein